jgi:menaquinone-dependent protoporphyrinogen oxidase
MRILVTAASKHGATTEIAESIAATLRDEGIEVDIRPPDDVETLEGYDGVVVGSGVYAGHWLEPAKRFVERHTGGLAARSVWLFSCGPIGDPPKPAEDPVDVAPLVSASGAREHRLFPGRLIKRSLGFAERAIVTALRAPEGDFRPWPEIDEWARSIAASLRAPVR